MKKIPSPVVIFPNFFFSGLLSVGSVMIVPNRHAYTLIPPPHTRTYSFLPRAVLPSDDKLPLASDSAASPPHPRLCIDCTFTYIHTPTCSSSSLPATTNYAHLSTLAHNIRTHATLLTKNYPVPIHPHVHYCSLYPRPKLFYHPPPPFFVIFFTFFYDVLYPLFFFLE